MKKIPTLFEREYANHKVVGIKPVVTEGYVEGLVFWKDGEPKCKIKRSDFGFDWN